ncbi:paraneoplastic Ma antigen, partial [Perkinsus olseni]
CSSSSLFKKMDPSLYFALPESFDPLTSVLDFEQWIHKFKACATANEWDDNAQLRHLPPLLRGDAWILYDELAPGEKDTMPHLVTNLTKKLNVASQMQSSEELYRRVLDTGTETLLTYQNDIKRLAHRAYPDMSSDQLKPIVLTAFIRGLRGHSPALARKVRNANPTTLQAALEKAQFILSDPFPEGEHEATGEVSVLRSGGAEERQVGSGIYAHDDDGLLVKSSFTSHDVTPAEPTPPTPTTQADPTPAWVPHLVNAIREATRRCDYCGRSGHVEA